MKESNYNLLFSENENKFLYNILNNTLISIEDESVEKLRSKKYDSFSADEKDFLLNQGVLIHNDTDELRIIKERNLRGKYSNDILSLTIIPSLICNFRCIYCYQDVDKTIMNEKTESDILNFIRNAIKNIKTLEITWFGGEPLLQMDIIRRMSKIIIGDCDNEKVKYNASIITNGYLLDENLAREFKNLKIADVQITIDGPKEIHNARRKHISSADTYTRCIEAVKALKKQKIHTNIRINVDQRNIDLIETLFYNLKDEHLTGINISVEKVSEFTSTCADTENNYFSCTEMNEILSTMNNKLQKLCLYEDENDFYPRLKYNYCGACQILSLTIGPSGELYKCWCDIGNKEKVFGNISEYDMNDDLDTEECTYMQYDVFENEKCLKCKVLPLCMGGCPRNGISGDVNCVMSEEYLINKLKNYIKVTESNA